VTSPTNKAQIQSVPKTRRLSVSAEGLNSSRAQSPGELWLDKVTGAIVALQSLIQPMNCGRTQKSDISVFPLASHAGSIDTLLVVVVSSLPIRKVLHLHFHSKQSARTPRKTVRLSSQVSLNNLTLKTHFS